MTNLDGYDWNAVGYACNQLPGSPEVVAQAATRFRNTANHLNLAARSLRRLDNSSDTCSEAVDQIVGKANEVAGLLDQVYARYATAAGALSAYAPALAHAQQQAEQALRGAAQAKHEHDVAQRNAVQAYDHARASTDPLERQELLQHYYSQKSRAESSASSLDNARAIIAGAIHERDLAGKKAAGQIDGAIHDSQINDGLFDHLKEAWDATVEVTAWILDHNPALKAVVEAVKAIAKWVWDNIDTIATVLTIAAFALSWIPGVGQVALVLAVAARVAAAISTVRSSIQLAQALFTSLSSGDWAPFIQSAGTFAVSFAVGKVASRLAKNQLGKVSKSAMQQLARESRRQTGSLRTANNAIVGRLQTPSYHPGHNPLSQLTERGRKTDSLLSTFKGSDYTQQVANLGHVVHIAESSAAKSLLAQAIKSEMDPIKQVGDKVVDSGVEYYEAHFGSRKVTQACSPSFSGAGAGASGGW